MFPLHAQCSGRSGVVVYARFISCYYVRHKQIPVPTCEFQISIWDFASINFHFLVNTSRDPSRTDYCVQTFVVNKCARKIVWPESVLLPTVSTIWCTPWSIKTCHFYFYC